MTVANSHFDINCTTAGCRVYLIEDDAALCRQLELTLQDAGLQVLAFNSAEDFLLNGVDYAPSVIVSDMVLPGLSGLQLYQNVREAGIESPIIFISGYSEPNQIIDAMKHGAVDFLWKPFKTEVLLNAVVSALSADMHRQLHKAQQVNLALRWGQLTMREQDICRLMLKGFGNKDISESLEIQPDTANKHRTKILKKLGVSTRPQLMALLAGFDPAH